VIFAVICLHVFLLCVIGKVREFVWKVATLYLLPASYLTRNGEFACLIINVVGIANHEEYSLVRDLPDSEREKTLTLKRDKSIAKDQKKMDEMKKKLHTDDERTFIFYVIFLETIV